MKKAATMTATTTIEHIPNIGISAAYAVGVVQKQPKCTKIMASTTWSMFRMLTDTELELVSAAGISVVSPIEWGVMNHILLK